MAQVPETLTPKIDVQPPLVRAPLGEQERSNARHFESVYTEARRGGVAVPWDDGRANPPLVSWLNVAAPRVIRPGARAVVVGCGLACDVEELHDRGYDVTGFDVSREAIDWARQTHPRVADRLCVADVFDPPDNLLRRFDLVVEINTLQAVEPSLRGRAADGIARLAKPHGSILVIARGRDDNDPLPDEPPYPLSSDELCDLMTERGLSLLAPLDDFDDCEDPPVRRLRGVFRRK